MRRLSSLAILAASIALAGCSSGAATPSAAAPTEASPAAGASAAPPSAAPPSAAPTESSAAVSAEPSFDASMFGSEYAKIQSDLQAEMAKIAASMGTATTPEQLKAVFKQYADVMRKSIAASRAVSWPPAISGDMDKLLADEEELVNLWEQMMNDPTATTNQDKMTQLQSEMTTLAQKIAGYFGVSVP